MARRRWLRPCCLYVKPLEMNGISLLLGLAAAAAVAAPAAQPARQPVKPWMLDYGATACTAVRVYGDDAKPLTLGLRPSPDGRVVRLVLVKAGRRIDAEQRDVTVNLGAHEVKTTGLHFGSRDGKAELVWINLTRADLEPLRAAPEIEIRDLGGSERFALPLIGKVLDSLDTCNEDLRRYWNVDGTGAVLSTMAAPVRPLASYFSDSDYPTQSLRQEDSGRSVVVVMVDETGAPKDCLVQETSGIAALDAMTCLVLQERAKFHPALDAAGKPARSVLIQPVVWRMTP